MSRFIRPVSDPVTQQFGENPDYYRSLGQLGHTGIDYGCSMGTSVRATGDGRVSFAGPGANHGGFLAVAGNAILLDHGDVYSAYSHLSRFAVGQGQQVSQGQVIGYSGNTGQVTGPHLHFEFWGKPTNWKNGWSGRVDPGNYITNEGDEMIEDNDSSYERWWLAMRRIRGSAAAERFSRDIYRSTFVGQSKDAMIDRLMHDAEADYREHAGDIGNVAIVDNWYGKLSAVEPGVSRADIDVAVKEAQEAFDAVLALRGK